MASEVCLLEGTPSFVAVGVAIQRNNAVISIHLIRTYACCMTIGPVRYDVYREIMLEISSWTTPNESMRRMIQGGPKFRVSYYSEDALTEPG